MDHQGGAEILATLGFLPSSTPGGNAPCFPCHWLSLAVWTRPVRHWDHWGLGNVIKAMPEVTILYHLQAEHEQAVETSVGNLAIRLQWHSYSWLQSGANLFPYSVGVFWKSGVMKTHPRNCTWVTSIPNDNPWQSHIDCFQFAIQAVSNVYDDHPKVVSLAFFFTKSSSFPGSASSATEVLLEAVRSGTMCGRSR